MQANHNIEKLTLRSCYEYIDEYVFKLSSPEIHKQHPEWPGHVGLEVEMLPVMQSNDTVPPVMQRKNNPVMRALNQLAHEKGWELLQEDYGQEKLTLVLKISNGETISFEPGGQVEYSSQPFTCLDGAQARVLEVQQCLDTALQKESVKLIQIGVDPWHGVDQVGIQSPKKRYRAMDLYFRGMGSETGPRMMRLSCSIQVCLDFGQSNDLMLKRYLVAQLLAPIGAAIFANSPYFEQKMEANILSHRTAIWRSLDAKRTGFVGLKALNETFTREACVEAYLDYALSCPVVFVEELDYLVPTKPFRMRDWIAQGIQGVFPTLHDFIVHLSLLFPEVRPRGYMEMRSIDCLPRFWQIAPGAFYVGLLYDHKNLETVLDTLIPTLDDTKEHMLLSMYGLHTRFLHEQSKTMMELAIEGLRRMPVGFCGLACEKLLTAFYHRFTEPGRTPANDLVDFVKHSGRSFPSFNDFVSLENQWQHIVT